MYLGGAPGYKTRMVSVGVSERALCPWLGGSIVGKWRQTLVLLSVDSIFFAIFPIHVGLRLMVSCFGRFFLLILRPLFPPFSFHQLRWVRFTNCGCPSRNMRNLVPPSLTESALKIIELGQ